MKYIGLFSLALAAVTLVSVPVMAEGENEGADGPAATAKDIFLQAHTLKLEELVEAAELNCDDENALQKKVKAIENRILKPSKKAALLNKLMGVKLSDIKSALNEVGDNLVTNLCTVDEGGPGDEVPGDEDPGDEFNQ